MTNEFIKAISNALKKEYPLAEIYFNEIKQGFKEPCFLITLINSEIDRVHSNRKFKRYNFIIQAFVEEGDREELVIISDTLEHILEYIEVGENKDIFMGKSIKSKIVDGILNFQVSYSGYIHEIDDTERISSLKNDINIKEDE